MRELIYHLEVECEDSAGTYFEWYECFSSFDAYKIWDRIKTNPSAIRAWVCESGKREEKLELTY
jgi:hypothetical protein